MFCQQLAVVFDLVGATCGENAEGREGACSNGVLIVDFFLGSMVIFIFPALFWYKFGPEDSPIYRIGGSIFLWVVGVTIMIMGTAVTIITNV
jgi:hypothetical protein